MHPGPMTLPIACGDSLAGCHTPPDQMEKLLEAGRKYKAYRHWDRIRIGRSQQDITGNGFNAIRFDPRKPAHTIRRMDSNLGMGGAMRWDEKRRFSLPEFKRFGSFPDEFVFAGEFEEGIKQIGNCVPPLFMRAIALHVRQNILSRSKEAVMSKKSALIPSKVDSDPAETVCENCAGPDGEARECGHVICEGCFGGDCPVCAEEGRH